MFIISNLVHLQHVYSGITDVKTERWPQSHVMCLCIQLHVQATDGRVPENTANATIILTVTRDESVPYFENTPYDDAKVSENAEVGADFYSKLHATDNDLQVHLPLYIVCICS